VRCVQLVSRVTVRTRDLSRRQAGEDVDAAAESAAGLTRLDVRGIRIMSVDPPGCVDIDDALSVTRGSEWQRRVATGDKHAPFGDCAADDLIVGVHIADVSAFIAAGSDSDRDARARGTTVYLPDRRIDMLPAVYSTDLCSLHEVRSCGRRVCA
jgi:exoribonuclease R